MSQSIGIFYNINHNPMYNNYNNYNGDDKKNMALEPVIPLSSNCLNDLKYVNISNTYVESFEKTDKNDIKYKALELYFQLKGDRSDVSEIYKNIFDSIHFHFHLLETSLKKIIKDENECSVNLYDLCAEFLCFHCNEHNFCIWLESNTSMRSITIRFIATELTHFFSIFDLKMV